MSKNILRRTMEVVIVLLPLYIGLFISASLDLKVMKVTGDVVVMGGWPQPVGLLISLFLLYLLSKRDNLKWKDFGLTKPKKWWKTIFIGICVSGIIFVSVAFVINPIMRAVFPNTGQDLSNFNHLEGHIVNLIIQLVMIWITAAFLEEVLWRGFIIERILGYQKKPPVWLIIVVLIIGSAIFGMAHLYQGPAGIFKTGAIGLVFCGCYFLVGRKLWPLIIAHGIIDTLDMIQHYLGN